jgi:hypothetical protein
VTARRLVVVALLLCGCARRVQPPSADVPADRPFPDMSGRDVMVMPVQGATPSIAVPLTSTAVALTSDARTSLEAELSFWLPDAAPRVRWLLPAAVERAARNAPTLGVHVRELQIQELLRARLQSIGDPLYTELRQVALLTNVRPALVPIGAVWIGDADGTGRVHLAAALIDTHGGAVLWNGVVAGTRGPAVNAATIASVAQALARMAAR